MIHIVAHEPLQNVAPDPAANCGPYAPVQQRHDVTTSPASAIDHDTVNTLGVSTDGMHVVAGTTTNGRSFKIPG